MITTDRLLGKNIKELSFWGQQLCVNIYAYGDTLNVLRIVRDNSKCVAGYWHCQGISCDWDSFTMEWQAFYMESKVTLLSIGKLLKKYQGWFALSTGSEFCEEVEGEGIGFDINSDGLIIKAWYFEHG